MSATSTSRPSTIIELLDFSRRSEKLAIASWQQGPYRAMYCSLLEQWLGHDAAPIIPGASSFERPTLVKA